MVPDRPGARVLAVTIAVVVASLLVPGALAQAAGQGEQEPNDSPLNATFVAPGTPVSGEINSTSVNASGADADWFAVPVQAGQEVSVSFESGNDSERLLVFLASPNGSRNVSAVNDTLADATIAPPGSTVTLSATANQSRVYFVGVTGLSGAYEFTVETSAGAARNGTNATDGMNDTGTVNASGAPTETTSTPTATSTATPTDTTTTTTTTTATSGGDGTATGEGTSASGPGFGLLAAVVALLAAALLATRRR